MAVVVWLVEGTWPSCVDAARRYAPETAEFVLLHVLPADTEGVAHGALAGLLGRGRHGPDPGDVVAALSADAEQALLDGATERLGVAADHVRRERRSGRVEREVVAAAEGADLLVAARDGDRSRLGPKSLGPATRFVVDHAPCPVLLVWPEAPPGVASIPPPPAHPPGHPHGHGPGKHGPGGHGAHHPRPH